MEYWKIYKTFGFDWLHNLKCFMDVKFYIGELEKTVGGEYITKRIDEMEELETRYDL